MTTSGEELLWYVKEVIMPITYLELMDTKSAHKQADQVSASWTQNNCHSHPWQSRDAENTYQPLLDFKAFLTFCRSLAVAKIFLQWNHAEADQLRSWLKLADPTFDMPLRASVDWRCIAPVWRSQESLKPFVNTVRQRFRYHQHRRKDPKTHQLTYQNHHCAAVPVLRYPIPIQGICSCRSAPSRSIPCWQLSWRI